MKVPLREIPCHRSIALSNERVRGAVSGLPIRAALERPDDDPDAGQAHCELDFYIEGDNVFARGSIKGWVEVACGRCVETVRVSIDEQLTVTYLPREQVPEDPKDGEEVEITEDDLDLYPYDGDELDLTSLLDEQIVMAVPFAPLCADDCKGLCSSCGANLNTDPCDCDRHVGDPRLAALKDLKV